MTVPSGGPQNMTAIGLNETAVQVRWREVHPLKVNGPITGYEIVYREESGGPFNVVIQAQNLKKENDFYVSVCKKYVLNYGIMCLPV